MVELAKRPATCPAPSMTHRGKHGTCSTSPRRRLCYEVAALILLQEIRTKRAAESFRVASDAIFDDSVLR